MNEKVVRKEKAKPWQPSKPSWGRNREVSKKKVGTDLQNVVNDG